MSSIAPDSTCLNRERQGATRRSDLAREKLDDRGYIMVVLLIGMAVVAVWMSALLPSWRQQATRQKEADLIFRGEQYARAIALYYRKNNNTLPNNIDVLVSQRYLRRKYKDPITGQDFLPTGGVTTGLPQSGGRGVPQQQGGRGQAPQGPAPPSSQLPQGRSQTPQGLASPQPQLQQAGLPPGRSGQAGPGITGGISGVRSTSNETSIRVYRGQQSYSQFPFDYTAALQRMGAGTTGPVGEAPGRGRGRGAPAPVRQGEEVVPIQPGLGRGRGVDGGARTGGPAGRGAPVGQPPPGPGRGR
jgi:type II secretory pathway pseudopilin PulG